MYNHNTWTKIAIPSLYMIDSIGKKEAKNVALPVKIIYLENLMLETMNCAMKMVACRT